MPKALKVIESTVALKESIEDNLGIYIIRGVYDYTFKSFQKLFRMKRYYVSDKERENYARSVLTATRNSIANLSDEQLIQLIRQAINDATSNKE